MPDNGYSMFDHVCPSCNNKHVTVLASDGFSDACKCLDCGFSWVEKVIDDSDISIYIDNGSASDDNPFISGLFGLLG